MAGGVKKCHRIQNKGVYMLHICKITNISMQAFQMLREMGFAETDVIDALRINGNREKAAVSLRIIIYFYQNEMIMNSDIKYIYIWSQFFYEYLYFKLPYFSGLERRYKGYCFWTSLGKFRYAQQYEFVYVVYWPYKCFIIQ